MLSTSDIEKKLKEIKPELQHKYNVRSIGFFGSYSMGKQTGKSDLDLLVEFSKPIGWDFFTLEQYLEKILGIQIDLVTRNSLKERLKESILKQVRYI